MGKFKNVIWIVALIILIVLIGIISYGYYRNATMEVTRPVATMEVENFGTVKFELYPEYAPETVANFITLANRGFYDGLTFHRIVKDFMIQGGDKNGDGTGVATTKDLRDDGDDTEYTIKGEFISNNVDNKLQFEEGVVAMARSDYTNYSSSLKEESYNSGSSQFFIMTAENTSLNGQYTSFGKVTEGMDIVHKIEEVENQTDRKKRWRFKKGSVNYLINLTPQDFANLEVCKDSLSFSIPQENDKKSNSFHNILRQIHLGISFQRAVTQRHRQSITRT